MPNNATSAPTTIRCAIYTRKSTEEGLKQDFNSLDAQRDAATAYVRSQAGEGWKPLPEFYDDGGFTGANMQRPALRRLLADVEAKKVDCVVVYKVDRLSRSIRDFARIMEILEQHGATFVSVNTNTKAFPFVSWTAFGGTTGIAACTSTTMAPRPNMPLRSSPDAFESCTSASSVRVAASSVGATRTTFPR